jgi:thiamine biosynthesis lipoprotein
MTQYECQTRIADRLAVCKRRRRKLRGLVVASLTGLLLLGGQSRAHPEPAQAEPTQAQQRFEFRRIEMGCDFRVEVYGCDSDAANNAAEAAFDRVRELNDLMSDYIADSEVRRLCDEAQPGQPVRVSSDLFRVLDVSLTLWRETDGAFDVTVGPLTKLWRRARRRVEMPPADQLELARQSVGSDAVCLDVCRSTVVLTRPGIRIDLGGIAKGYAADEALKILRERGFPHALIDASGDLVVGDPPPGKRGWRVAIEPLVTPGLSADSEAPASRAVRSVLLLANQAVATSGSTAQFVEINGRPYSHIVDPRTGLGLQTHSMVTVIAPTGIQADSLASAISVLGPESGIGLLRQSRRGDVEVRIQTLTADSQTQHFQSSGFERLLVDPAASH